MVFSGFNVPFNIFNQSILNFRQEVGGKIDGTWQNDEKIMGYHRDLDGFWGSQFLKLAGQGRFTSQQSKIEELAPKYCCSTNRKKELPNRAGKFPYVVDFPRKHMPFLMGISQPGWINRGVWQLIPGGFNDDGHPLLMPGLWPLTCPKWHGCRSSLWTISHFNLVEGGTTKKNQRFAYLNPEKTHYMTTWRQTKKSNQCKLQTQKISTTFCASHRPSHLGHGETVNRASPPSPPSPIKLCTNSSELTLASTPPWLNGSWDSEIQASSTRCRDLDVDGEWRWSFGFLGCWTLKQIKHISLSHTHNYIFII